MRKKVLLSAAVVVVILGAFGLYWFQPWKLFTSKTVNDEVPLLVSSPRASITARPTGQATATVLAEGDLITHEHDTSGSVQLIRLEDGRLKLILKDLATSDGPDLHIWLTDQPVVKGRDGWHLFDDGKYVEIGRLKGTHGTQVYDIPPSVVITDYKSITIWCKRFSVSFGAAPLAAI